MKVLDHGFVELRDSMANDLSVVNSARVSFGKYTNTIKNEDVGLIRYLMKHKHGTPFEHNAFMFHVKAPIFVFREWQRHRIGSYNEMSGRYMQLPREWYIPKPEDVRERIGKPGHYEYQKAPYASAVTYIDVLRMACEKSYNHYEGSLKIGLAPEQARLFLHVNHYSEMYWTVNARSLMNFLSLRNAPTAQWEIQQYAQAVEKLFAEKMPHTYEAFVENERIAP